MFQEFYDFITNELVLGAILGSIIIPFILYGVKNFIYFCRDLLPIRRVLSDFSKNDEKCVFWLRDAYQPTGTKILEISQHGAGVIPNVSKWWAEVDAKAVNGLFKNSGILTSIKYPLLNKHITPLLSIENLFLL